MNKPKLLRPPEETLRIMEQHLAKIDKLLLNTRHYGPVYDDSEKSHSTEKSIMSNEVIFARNLQRSATKLSDKEVNMFDKSGKTIESESFDRSMRGFLSSPRRRAPTKRLEEIDSLILSKKAQIENLLVEIDDLESEKKYLLTSSESSKKHD